MNDLKHLYRFNCTSHREAFSSYGWDEDPGFFMPDVKCAHCKDPIFYFIASPSSLHEDLVNFIVKKFKTKGDLRITLQSANVDDDDAHGIMPPSFLCLYDSLYLSLDGREDYYDPREAPTKILVDHFLKNPYVKDKLAVDLKDSIRDLGPISPGEIEALKHRKFYSKI